MIKKKENKILKYIKEHKILISIISIILVLIVSGTSLAIYLISDEGEEKTYTLGNIDVEYIDGETFKVTNSIPLADYEIEEYAAKKEFSFKNTGNITMYAEILLTDIEISNNLINNGFRWELYEENDNEYTKISEGSFLKVKETKTLSLKRGIRVEVGATSKKYRILVYIKDNEDNQNEMMNTNMSCKVTVRATDKTTLYEDNSGANPPKLADGMIPVTYDEENGVWIKADLYNKWYDYDEQMWANAVTVSTDASTCKDTDTCEDEFDKNNREYYLNAKPGTSISMDDINSMWVWIPRFKYRIPDSVGISTSMPPEIEVVFETGLSATGVKEEEYRNSITPEGTVPDSIYYTHPAFRDGSKVYNEEPYDIGGWDDELTGYWFGKFKNGGTASEPIIKPNVKSILQGDVNNRFTTSIKFANGTLLNSEVNFEINPNNIYGLNTKNNTTDSHSSKKLEYAAVSILSQSRYGKMGNDNFKNENKEVYINNSSSYYTGRSGGTPTMGANSLGTYSYNDNLCLSGDTIKCTGEKEKYKGTGASTTGTIYGTYDMNGGGLEYVMGSLNGKINTYPRKYYDPYNKSDLYNNSIMGDMIMEAFGWYGDKTKYDALNWICISGRPAWGSTAGIFVVDGCEYGSYGSRTVLIP